MEKLINQYKSMIDELLGQPKYNFDPKLSEKLPSTSGVYRIINKGDSEGTMYLGISKNLKRRIIGDHYKGDRVASTLKRKMIKHMNLENERNVAEYLSENCKVQFITIGDKKLAIGFEHFAISVLLPKLND